MTEPNSGDYVIQLKPLGQRRPVDAIIDDLRARLDAAEPALHTDFGQLLEDDIGDLTGGEPQPIDIKLFGEDQNLLQEKARQTAISFRTSTASRTSSMESSSPDRRSRCGSGLRSRVTIFPAGSRRSSRGSHGIIAASAHPARLD